MILLVLTLFKTSLGNELIYSDESVFYLAEIRSLYTQKNDNSSLALSFRSGLLSPPDTFYLSIDRAIITLKYRGFDGFLGRETVSWGYGLFYSPFSYARSYASPFDSELLQSGQNIVGINYQNIPFMTPELIVFLPRRSIERDSVMVGIRSNFFFSNLEFHTPLVYAADTIFTGLGFRFSLFDFTLFLDYSLSYTDTEIKNSAVTGFNRNIGSNLFIQAEYFYNQKGLNSEEYDNSSTEFLTRNLNLGYTGRHYIYSMAQWTFMTENTISFYSLIHPLWKSGLLGASVSSSRFENTLIMLNLVRILGGREFEYVPARNFYSLEFRYYF